ncbi:hypothetical protein F4777DRAFT_575573 [Nemania sp. FL0916]|nr:hypothetical protein F4777DRAFT_575573 [Nemania sp. FL0916]
MTPTRSLPPLTRTSAMDTCNPYNGQRYWDKVRGPERPGYAAFTDMRRNYEPNHGLGPSHKLQLTKWIQPGASRPPLDQSGENASQTLLRASSSLLWVMLILTLHKAHPEWTWTPVCSDWMSAGSITSGAEEERKTPEARSIYKLSSQSDNPDVSLSALLEEVEEPPPGSKRFLSSQATSHEHLDSRQARDKYAGPAMASRI